MQTFLITQSTWYLIAKEPEAGIPPRIAITPPFRVGRREGFDLCLNCRNVSGLHAEFIEENGQLWVDDLNSTNGTFVNENRIRTKTFLQDGDTVQFGQSLFSVVSVGANDSTVTNMFNNGEPAEIPESTEDRFQRLLENGVVPFFQPIYNIAGDSKQRIGFEVLGRSRLFGLKTPDQMFSAATDLEMESELSRVLRLRGIEAAESELPSDMMLFVNTHPAEMEGNEIYESLKEIRNKFPSRPIMVELPEQILYSPESYSEVCRGVKDLDVQLVLHDFGAGQIRLAELSELGPDVVKFDCALIHGIDMAGEKRQQLVSAMVKMVTELGIAPMAEYVETEGEHETLKQLGFQMVQGFHYGHPAAIESLESEKPDARIDPIHSVNRAAEMRPLEQLKSIAEAAELVEAETTEADVIDFSLDDFESLESKDAECLKKAISGFFGTTETEDSKKQLAHEINDAQWLLEQDDDCFTVQLMFSSSIEEAEKFVSERDQPGEYAIYRKIGSNREWSVVVCGIHDDREQAKTATAVFEGTGHSSWVRSLESVKNEIRSLAELQN